jgi:hypothetical protein
LRRKGNSFAVNPGEAFLALLSGVLRGLRRLWTEAGVARA